jgi:hypothetical protein
MTETLSSLRVDHVNLHLLIGWLHGNGIECGRLALSKVVTTHMRETQQRLLDDLKASSVVSNDSNMDIYPDECLQLARDTLIPVPELLIALDKVHEHPQIDARLLPGRAVLFYAIVAADISGKYIAFVRKQNAYTSLKPGYLTTIRDGVLDRVDTPLFTFDDRCDVVVTNDSVFVLSQNVYELLFENTEPVLERIPRHIEKIADALPLLDAEAGAQLNALALKSKRVRKQLRNLAHCSYLHKVTLERVREHMQEQGLEPDLLIRGDRLVLDATNPKLLVQVLDEQLFRGGFSGLPYLAPRKAVRSSKPEPHVLRELTSALSQ